MNKLEIPLEKSHDLEDMMKIDFSAVHERRQKISELAAGLTRTDLIEATNESIDFLASLVARCTDEMVTFLPDDPEADDPYAVEGEETISWSVAHLIAHVTASSEEAAAFSSLLARGVPAVERPRYETPWRAITSRAQCQQRLEESWRMRLAYLETWPDQPFLDVYRKISPRYEARVGPLNAIGAFLSGLSHETEHYAQIEEAVRQAKEALTSISE